MKDISEDATFDKRNEDEEDDINCNAGFQTPEAKVREINTLTVVTMSDFQCVGIITDQLSKSSSICGFNYN